MSSVYLLVPLALGIACGWLGGVFGIGGGIIAIPVLALAFGMDQQLAQGTALVMIVPTVSLGLWRYCRRSRIDPRIACTLAGSAILCTLIAAHFAVHLEARHLALAFAGFLVALAGYLAWRVMRGKAAEDGPKSAVAWQWSSLVGAAGGLLSGMFGVGGATIAPPALSLFFGMSQKEAQGLALALIAPGAVAALVSYAQAGEVNWPMGLALAIGGATSVSVGVAMAHHLPEKTLRLLFCGLICTTAAMLVVHSA